MQEYGYFFNKYSRIRNKGDLYVPVTIRILIQISLSSYFLTDVKKLYHICQKALSHIWKSFTTSVKNIKSNDNRLTICDGNYPAVTCFIAYINNIYFL